MDIAPYTFLVLDLVEATLLENVRKRPIRINVERLVEGPDAAKDECRRSGDVMAHVPKAASDIVLGQIKGSARRDGASALEHPIAEAIWVPIRARWTIVRWIMVRRDKVKWDILGLAGIYKVGNVL